MSRRKGSTVMAPAHKSFTTEDLKFFEDAISREQGARIHFLKHGTKPVADGPIVSARARSAPGRCTAVLSVTSLLLHCCSGGAVVTSSESAGEVELQSYSVYHLTNIAAHPRISGQSRMPVHWILLQVLA